MRNVQNVFNKFRASEEMIELTDEDLKKKAELQNELNYLVSKHRVVTLMLKMAFPAKNRYNASEVINMSF